MNASEVYQRRVDCGAQSGGPKGITVTLAWNSQVDLDLRVQTPCNNEVSYQRRACCGGELDRDCIPPFLNAPPVENVFFTNPPTGTYRVIVRNYSYHNVQRGTPVPFTVLMELAGKQEVFQGVCTCEGPMSDVVVKTWRHSGRARDITMKLLMLNAPVAVGRRTVGNVTTIQRTIEFAVELRNNERHATVPQQLTFLPDDFFDKSDVWVPAIPPGGDWRGNITARVKELRTIHNLQPYYVLEYDGRPWKFESCVSDYVAGLYNYQSLEGIPYRVGILGWTGSGKSSFFNKVFTLVGDREQITHAMEVGGDASHCTTRHSCFHMKVADGADTWGVDGDNFSVQDAVDFASGVWDYSVSMENRPNAARRVELMASRHARRKHALLLFLPNGILLPQAPVMAKCRETLKAVLQSLKEWNPLLVVGKVDELHDFIRPDTVDSDAARAKFEELRLGVSKEFNVPPNHIFVNINYTKETVRHFRLDKMAMQLLDALLRQCQDNEVAAYQRLIAASEAAKLSGSPREVSVQDVGFCHPAFATNRPSGSLRSYTMPPQSQPQSQPQQQQQQQQPARPLHARGRGPVLPAVSPTVAVPEQPPPPAVAQPLQPPQPHQQQSAEPPAVQPPPEPPQAFYLFCGGEKTNLEGCTVKDAADIAKAEFPNKSVRLLRADATGARLGKYLKTPLSETCEEPVFCHILAEPIPL